jgi:hypothetical protein
VAKASSNCIILSRARVESKEKKNEW